MRPTTDGRDTRNARGRATTRSIERHAVRLALEHGTAALTVDQICAAVGISQRTFFNHFDTKDDALLGWELPQLSEERVREYLADPRVGVLEGAIALVDLPSELSDDPELARGRYTVLTRSPQLGERQAARLHPLALEVAEIVYLKLRALSPSDRDDALLRKAAGLITQMAASLTLRLALEPLDPAAAVPSPSASVLDDLRWVWPQLISADPATG